MFKNRRHKIAVGFALASFPVMMSFQNCGQQGGLQVSESGLAAKNSSASEQVDFVVDAPVSSAPHSSGSAQADSDHHNDSDDSSSVHTADCRDIEIADIKLNIEEVDSTGQCMSQGQKASAEFEVSEVESFITLNKKSLKLRALKSGEVKVVFIKLAAEGNQILSLANEVIDLKTPSAQQSGLKFQLKQSIKVVAGQDYDLKFEIRAEDQMVANSVKCILKPVIKSARLVAVSSQFASR